MDKSGLKFLTLLLILGIVLTPATVFSAPIFTPPDPPGPDRSHSLQDEYGLTQLEGGLPTDIGVLQSGDSALSPEASGGPDYFGYTWDDSVAFSWIDATDGTNTGLVGEGSWNVEYYVPLPFEFRFYDQIYTWLDIVSSGYVSFGYDDYWPEQQNPFPSEDSPNNLIAPFWTVIHLSGESPDGSVFYKSGGTAPNRYFVVEWHNVAGGTENDVSDGDETYRFEVVLYENGDILLQYHTMTYNDWRYFASIGIEDFFGAGLGYMDWNNYWDRLPGSGKAILFRRPDPAARVKIYPSHHGEFASAGREMYFKIPVHNNGELGSDTYDVTATSTWPLSLYTPGGTPLVDTDGDGIVDTGPVAQDSSFTIEAVLAAPPVLNVGDGASASIVARSSLDNSKSSTATIRTTVPAPFAQAFHNSDPDLGLLVVRPDGQKDRKVYAGEEYPEELALIEADGFAYFWNEWGHLGDHYFENLNYTLLGRDGEVRKPTTRLTDNSAATLSTYDWEPVAATAPNGKICAAWYRNIWDEATDVSTTNIYFSILNADGTLATQPENLTLNVVPDYPNYYAPSIASTGDNHFVLAWVQTNYINSTYTRDVMMAAIDSSGNLITAPNLMTHDSGGFGSGAPALASLGGNRVIVFYQSRNGVAYQVVGSTGAIIKAHTELGFYGYNIDAVQLSDGHILFAWTDYNSMTNSFAILEGTTYALTFGPAPLNNPATLTGDYSVSVSADASGHGILTWMDYMWNWRQNLYYALVDSNGAVLTQPMVFKSSDDYEYPNMYTSYSGQGNTSNTINATTDGVDTYIQAPELLGIGPVGTLALPVEFGNHGMGTAASLTITTTLPVSTTYLSDTSGVTPVQNGNVITWNFIPTLDFLGLGRFNIHLKTESAEIGAQFPVGLELASENGDMFPEDNQITINLMISNQLYLPLLAR